MSFGPGRLLRFFKSFDPTVDGPIALPSTSMKACAGKQRSARRASRWIGGTLVIAVMAVLGHPAVLRAQTANPGGILNYTGSTAIFGAASDGAGNVYATNYQAGTISKLNFNGTTYTAATVATVAEPLCIVADKSGNLYVANGSSGNLLKFTNNGGTFTQSVLAAPFSANSGYVLGVAVDAAGDVFYSTYSQFKGNVYELPVSGSTYLAPVQLNTTSFTSPYGFSLDPAGNIYGSDTDSGTIYKLTKNGSSYTQSQLLSGLGNPEGVAADRYGNLYIHTVSSFIKAVPNGSSYTQSTLASDSTEGTVSIDPNGTIYASTGTDTTLTEVLTTPVSPTSPVGTAAAQTPVYFTITAAGTLPALSNSNVLTKGVSGLDFTLGIGSTCTGAVNVGQVCTVNVAFTPQYPGVRLGAVNLLNSSGAVIATAFINGLGNSSEETSSPGLISTFASNTATTGLTLNGNQNVVLGPSGVAYVASGGNNTVYRINGGAAAAYGAGFNLPVALAVDGAGNLYVGEYSAGDIKVVNAATGATTAVTGATNLGYVDGIAVDGNGTLYASSYSNNVVYKITPAGGFSIVAGTGTAGYNNDNISATSAQLNTPGGLGVDSAGNLYIADSGNNRIRRVAASNGIITTVAGNGTPSFSGDGNAATSAGLNFPRGQVTVDAAGDIYFADFNNHRIREVSAATSNIATIVGTGTAGSTGDGGSATAAQINTPLGLFLAPDGTLYVSDSSSSSVRSVSTTAAPLYFPNTAVGGTSASQAVFLNNIGNVALKILQTSGQNPSLSNYFTLSNSSTCPVVTPATNPSRLAIGASCSEIISYAPTVAGTVSGNLVVTDDSLEGSYVTQTVLMTGSTGPSLAITVINQNAKTGTPSVTLEFTVGYGANPAPTGAPILEVAGSTSGVGTVTCTVKIGHNNCTATFSTLTLAQGTYNIKVTQPADSNYTSATIAHGTLTITNSAGTNVIHPILTPRVPISAPVGVASGSLTRTTLP